MTALNQPLSAVGSRSEHIELDSYVLQLIDGIIRGRRRTSLARLPQRVSGAVRVGAAVSSFFIVQEEEEEEKAIYPQIFTVQFGCGVAVEYRHF